MSVFRHKSNGRVTGVRCDWCGKIANNDNGEYQRPVCNDAGIPLAGYIHSPDWDKNGVDDICEECAANLCPLCGSNQIVQTTPTVPGPTGWGGRCKDCNQTWGLFVKQEEQP